MNKRLTKHQELRRSGHQPGVYALVDPRDNRVRYIGMSKHVGARHIEHVHAAGRPADPRRKWIVELRQEGLTPEFVLLEGFDVYDRVQLRAAEHRWIAKFRHRGEADLNTHSANGTLTAYAKLQQENAELRKINAFLLDLLIG
ncbi:hypothetical protein QZM99_00585 [Burkholderia gladioli]|uniref:hypothetical protein n=1 Tax=Burkholderia gladioli TaxID=28095 RepID=UPI00264BF10D|nr:hypothetical protein [Burkholderia gladioli]MDN7916587.1 hypothetical protein [Burkholderia gladioli]